MNTLPAIPQPGTAISLSDVLAIEASIAHDIATVTDVDALHEMRAKAEALASYLKGKELHGPMMGAQRRIEARIGQLLGTARNGGDCTKEHFPHAGSEISATDRQRFRILARGLEHGLSDEDWRCAREPLIKIIQGRFPMPRHIPTVVTEAGTVRKPRADRIKEISSMVEQGMRAAQIAKELNISEQQVRALASKEGVVLPDFAIGKRRGLDAARIMTETINGVDAYVSGLSMLDGAEFPELSPEVLKDLMQALSRSINGLRKLRIKMEAAYARPDSSAA